MTSSVQNGFRKIAGMLVHYTFLVILLGLTIYPIFFMLFTSVKSGGQFSVNYFLPDFSAIHWENYVIASQGVLPFIYNSIKVSGLTLFGVLLIGTMTAYVFARFDFPGKEPLYLLLLSTMMIPGILLFVPMFILVRDLGLLNTHYALIYPWIAGGMAFAVFLMRSFFAAIDEELLEAARLDGATEGHILFYIILPLSIPMMMTVAVLNILATWNQFLWPLVTISDPDLFIIPIGLALLEREYVQTFPTQMAGYTVASIPLVLLFIFTMKYFIRGLSSGAIKA